MDERGVLRKALRPFDGLAADGAGQLRPLACHAGERRGELGVAKARRRSLCLGKSRADLSLLGLALVRHIGVACEHAGRKSTVLLRQLDQFQRVGGRLDACQFLLGKVAQGDL